ncbi:putative isochorismatase family protein YaaI [Capsulimonas corticalis]|uniref:Isochorismatase family protein YaaI n=1 Tax=Capsulimonas corticalis TaxID=2219043 RepID=A0A402D1C6_9BACT|nr:cysteine hydrolase [Capsulimonas corticalis]BDI31598.1 putative isochorismatase family protein YaaI [Capsulimonas corticalis]
MSEQTPPVALLLIDVINDLEFEGGDKLLEYAIPMAKQIVLLKTRAREAQIPVIYVNDNFGIWRSNFNTLIERCIRENLRGKRIVELLTPTEKDYLVLKPKHSGFFSTHLELLLNHLNINTLIMTGIAGNICVLVTAHDAYMRGYNLYIPQDCIASNSLELNNQAIAQMEGVAEVNVRNSTEIDLLKTAREAANQSKRQNPILLMDAQASR